MKYVVTDIDGDGKYEIITVDQYRCNGPCYEPDGQSHCHHCPIHGQVCYPDLNSARKKRERLNGNRVGLRTVME